MRKTIQGDFGSERSQMLPEASYPAGTKEAAVRQMQDERIK